MNADKAYEVLERSETPDWQSLIEGYEFESGYRNLQTSVDTLVSQISSSDSVKADGAFEAELGVLLHDVIPWSTRTGDPGFWRWLSFRIIPEAILSRHGQKNAMPHRANYGIGPMPESLAYRSWLRADIGCDEQVSKFDESRYKWARVGDQDIWRSHLVRIRYSYSRPVARALLEFQYPNADERALLKKGDKTTGIRMLSKRLTRLHANLCLPILNKEEALKMISDLAIGLELDGGGTYTDSGAT